MHHSEQKYAHLNGVLWDMEQVYYGICEFGLLGFSWNQSQQYTSYSL